MTYYDTQRAARYLGIAVRAVREYCASGELPALKEGRSYLIAGDALESFKRALEAKGTRRGPKPHFEA